MSRSRVFVAVLTVLACLSATSALAGAYLGASTGQSNAEASGGGADISFNGDTTGWKAFGGFTFMRFFAVEAAYVDFGTIKDQSSGQEIKVDATAVNAFAVGKFPIGFFEPFVKVGYAYVDSKVSGAGSSASDKNSNLVYGAGVAFNFLGRFQIRAEYEKYDLSPNYYGVEPNSDLYMVSIGAAFRF
jgi:OmpA-OmpF porin, OOP family